MQKTVIDFHTHIFPDKIAVGTLAHLAGKSHTKYFTDGTLSGLVASMGRTQTDAAGSAGENTNSANSYGADSSDRQADFTKANGTKTDIADFAIRYSVNLPVMTAPAQCDKVNDNMMRDREAMLQKGIIAFGGMHPDYENYRQKLKELASAGIPGIKLHPAYQSTDLNDIRYLRIIDAASEAGLIVLIHAGIDVGIPGHDFADTRMILQVIKEVHPEKFVLAHMGGWNCWDAVERDLAGAPVYLDTAFSIGKVTPAPDSETAPCSSYNLSEETFLCLARKHGMDKVLFATDSPWEDQMDYIKRLDGFALTGQEKEQLFHLNAEKLLGAAVLPITI